MICRWASFKLSGMHVLSDGRGNFYSKLGKKLHNFPQWIISALEGIPIEFILRLFKSMIELFDFMV
jgi:hypothetical protein